jgi:glycosyltransferase involved in cell wall biosynthesis
MNYYFLCNVRVLILHQHFNTPARGGPLRSYYLAQALANFGIEPVVITAHNKADYMVEKIKGIEVHYLPIAYDNRFTFFKRSVSFLKYIYRAVSLAKKIQDINRCYAISVPLTIGIAAMWIKRKKKIPFIFEVGDLWPDAPVELGYVKNYFFRKLLYWLERKIYQSASSIVALSPAIQHAIEKKISGKKVHLVPNMADTDFYKPAARDPLLAIKYHATNKFVISYTGALGAANGLDYFLDCAKQSQIAGLPIQFIICGDGAMLNHLTQRALHLDLQNLEFASFQNREGVREILDISDASFISYQPFKILETGSPNKYFDGLAAGKLIIINFSGWIEHEIESHECGFSCDPHNPKDFTEKIQLFLNDLLKTKKYQASARILAEQVYSRRILSEKFVRIVKAID